MDDSPFCRHHDDTPQAQVYEQALTATESGSKFGGMETHCENCDASLRRTERLSRHPNHNRRVVFEAVVKCDCSEHVLGAHSEHENAIPDGWDA